MLANEKFARLIVTQCTFHNEPSVFICDVCGKSCSDEQRKAINQIRDQVNDTTEGIAKEFPKAPSESNIKKAASMEKMSGSQLPKREASDVWQCAICTFEPNTGPTCEMCHSARDESE